MGPVVAGSLAALGSRLDRPRVKEGGGRFLLAAFGQAEDAAEVVGHLLEDARVQPAAGLVVNGVPGGKSLGR